MKPTERTHLKSICITCNKLFYKRSPQMANRGRIYDSNVRPSSSITCSNKCSILYNRNKWKYLTKPIQPALPQQSHFAPTGGVNAPTKPA